MAKEQDNPSILLDEATTSLDVENESHVQESLSCLLVGKTVLVIAHRMRTVLSADKIVVLREGRVVEQGTPADLLAQEGLFARIVELQNTSAARSLQCQKSQMSPRYMRVTNFCSFS